MSLRQLAAMGAARRADYMEQARQLVSADPPPYRVLNRGDLEALPEAARLAHLDKRVGNLVREYHHQDWWTVLTWISAGAMGPPGGSARHAEARARGDRDNTACRREAQERPGDGMRGPACGPPRMACPGGSAAGAGGQTEGNLARGEDDHVAANRDDDPAGAVAGQVEGDPADEEDDLAEAVEPLTEAGHVAGQGDGDPVDEDDGPTGPREAEAPPEDVDLAGETAGGGQPADDFTEWEVDQAEALPEDADLAGEGPPVGDFTGGEVDQAGTVPQEWDPAGVGTGSGPEEADDGDAAGACLTEIPPAPDGEAEGGYSEEAELDYGPD